MLSCREFGSTDAPPILFIHGAGVSGWMWRPQVAALPEYRSLVVDLPAHGQSRGVPWHSVPATAAAVAALIQSRSPGRPVDVVGLSLGAVVGYELVAAYPALVESLVLSGGLGVGLRGSWLVGPLLRATLPLARFRPLVASTLAIMRVPREDRSEALAEMVDMSPAALRTIVDDVFRYRLRDELGTRPHRLLALAGTLEHPAVHRTLRRLVELMPNAAAAVVPRGLHTWNWQYPTLFTAVIRAWLSNAPLPPGPRRLSPLSR